MGLLGLWIAKVINEFYIFITYCIVLCVINWDERAQEAAERQAAKLKEDEDFAILGPKDR